MKLVYFGSASFAVPALTALAENVALVVSQPDQPSGRGMQLRPTPVKQKAAELGLEVITPIKCRSAETIDRIRSVNADALVVAAYGQILSEPLLNSAVRGGINLHGSILPRWRGAAPIQRAIAAGDSFTGVTLMQMDKGMDTGDIIATEPVSIAPNETAGELFDRLSYVAADLAVAWMPAIISGSYPRLKQDDSLATLAPKVAKCEAVLTSDLDCATAYNRFRAFTPFPGAWIQTNFGVVKILKARLAPGLIFKPGVLAAVKPELIVGLRDGALCLETVQPEGRKPMKGSDFANGAHLEPGDGFF